METGRPISNKSLFSVTNEDTFRISFTDDIFIENLSNNTYKFDLKNESNEVIGYGELNPFTWMAFPFETIQNYQIDFFNLDGELVNTYYNDLKSLDGAHILLNVKFSTPIGKSHNISLLDEVVNDIKRKYRSCEVFIYFKGSEKYDFSGKNYSPIRMNDIIPHFNLMTTIYV